MESSGKIEKYFETKWKEVEKRSYPIELILVRVKLRGPGYGWRWGFRGMKKF